MIAFFVQEMRSEMGGMEWVGARSSRAARRPPIQEPSIAELTDSSSVSLFITTNIYFCYIYYFEKEEEEEEEAAILCLD